MSTAPHPPSAPPRPLWQTYLAFLGPMVLSNILQALSGSANAVYLGQMLGVGAMLLASRTERDTEQEFAEALQQIERIALFRLQARLSD